MIYSSSIGSVNILELFLNKLFYLQIVFLFSVISFSYSSLSKSLKRLIQNDSLVSILYLSFKNSKI